MLHSSTRDIVPRNKIRPLLLVAESNFRIEGGKQPRYRIFSFAIRERSNGVFVDSEDGRERERGSKKRDGLVSS